MPFLLNLTLSNAQAKLLSKVIYFALALVLVVPFLEYQYLFAADQYVHAYNTCVLEELRSSADSYYKGWFHVNTFPEPNWVGHALLWVLAKAMPIYVAEKVFVLLLVVGNGYAMLSEPSPLGSLDKGAITNQWPWPYRTAAAVASLIFLFGAIWQLGFVNYLLGMVAVMVSLTFTAAPKSSRRFEVLVCSLLTYFCHPIAFLFFMGTFCLREILHRNLLTTSLQPRQGDWFSFFKAFAVWFGLPLCSIVAYVATHSEVSTLRGASPSRLLEGFLYHNDLALFVTEERFYGKLALFSAIALTVLGAALLFKHRLSFTLAFAGAVVLLGAIVLSPDYFAGGAYIHQRLLPFLFVWGLWCAAHAFSMQAKVPSVTGIVVGYTLLVLVAVSVVGLTYHRSQAIPAIVEVLDEYKSFSTRIPARSSVLPVSASATAVVKGKELSLKPVFHHFGAILDCRAEVVLLDNYEARVGYFPLLWKADLNSFTYLTTGLEEHPARIPATGEEWLSKNVDYLLTMGNPREAFTPETLYWIEKRFGESLSSEKGNFHLIQLKK